MNTIVLIKPDIQEKFENFIHTGRIAFFSAPCGFGKTTVVHELLKNKKTYEVSADSIDFSKLEKNNCKFVIVDNLQLLHE